MALLRTFVGTFLANLLYYNRSSQRLPGRHCGRRVRRTELPAAQRGAGSQKVSVLLPKIPSAQILLMLPYLEQEVRK